MSQLPGLVDQPIWWLAIAVLGLIVGIIGGMFGIGGNFLLIPVLTALFRVPLPIAVGTALCQIIGTGVSSLRRHHKQKNGEIRIDWLMLVGGLFGASVGSQLFSTLAAGGNVTIFGYTTSLVKFTVSTIYIVLLGGVAVWMMYDSRSGAKIPTVGAGPLTRHGIGPKVWLPNLKIRIAALTGAYLGLALGFLSGLVGMGGGVILMPILIYGFGMGVRMAAGTGIFVLICSAAVATASHAWQGHVHLGLAVTLLLGSTIGAPLGANFTLNVEPRRLRRIFAWMVLLTALSVIWDLVRTLK
ncbi:MAG: sulfite exporter TauE/SafE family protein [Chthonomonadales bacterium]